MAIKNIKLQNFTAFQDISIEFSSGLNILIGVNGTGKTHIMKILYSACEASEPSVSFSEKLVKVFRTDNFAINRLITKGQGNKNASLKIASDLAKIELSFSKLTKKWDANVSGETNWENKHQSEIISTFIPVEEMLSHAYKFEAAQSKNNVDFDDTYVDIIKAAKLDISSGKNSAQKAKYLRKLQDVLEGTIKMNNDEKFYLKEKNQALIEFNLVAEGIKKLGLLWLLIKNGTLEKGSVLFWDEPEANINPTALPVLVDILLELQREGVQIFLATHDYNLAKYFEVKKTKNDQLLYHCLFKTSEGVKATSSETYRGVEFNPIELANEILHNDIIDKASEVLDDEQ